MYRLITLQSIYKNGRIKKEITLYNDYLFKFNYDNYNDFLRELQNFIIDNNTSNIQSIKIDYALNPYCTQYKEIVISKNDIETIKDTLKILYLYYLNLSFRKLEG